MPSRSLSWSINLHLRLQTLYAGAFPASADSGDRGSQSKLGGLRAEHTSRTEVVEHSAWHRTPENVELFLLVHQSSAADG